MPSSSAATAAAVRATRCLVHRATTTTTTTARTVITATVPLRKCATGIPPRPASLSYSAPRRVLSTRPATDAATSSEVEQQQFSDDDERIDRFGGLGGIAAGVSGVSTDARPWDASERRAGALAMKVGMVSLYDSWGIRHATTVLQLDECEVVQIKTRETDGYTSLQLGVGERKAKNVNKPLTKHFDKAGVKPKRQLMEFRVSKAALLPPGFRLRAQHFVPGQKIDACGTSKGKGFQGGMKRWGFAGQGASHGVSKTHRHIGSTGQCQDPGRVFKGKKMPGRMGSDRITVQNLKILKIDPARELLYVKGHVPGQNGGYIRVTDAVKGPEFPSDPPFPSFVAGEGQEDALDELWCPQGDIDPLEADAEATD